jgi:rhombotail lipoprotein
MRHIDPFKVTVAAVAILCAAACVYGRPMAVKSSALDFLYPAAAPAATEPRDVNLKLPLRVGVAFAPGGAGIEDPFTEVQKQELLSRIQTAFESSESVQSIDVIPSHYLSPGGSFGNLDRLATALGIDLIGLVSYDQRQFSETTGKSWTYLTVLGAYIVKGEKNETRTVMDAVIYDIPSRTLLFRAAGSHTSKGAATPIAVSRRLREASEGGFDNATDKLIENLDSALVGFHEQVKSGTVRGPGTPAIAVVSEPGGGGAGAMGPIELLAAIALLSLAKRSVGRGE